MNATELRKLLRDPCILNLVCALAALDRLYDGIQSSAAKITYEGHAFPITLYLLGFLTGLPALFVRPFRPVGRARYASYCLLLAASLVLVVIVILDAVSAARSGTPQNLGAPWWWGLSAGSVAAVAFSAGVLAWLGWASHPNRRRKDPAEAGPHSAAPARRARRA
jgi:hypothetical protein